MNRRVQHQLGAVWVGIALLASVAAAQAAPTPPKAHNHTTDDAAHEAMHGPAMAWSAHVRLTPRRIATARDTAHALAVADTLRRALARYADPAVAEREGFAPFLPNVKNQRTMHYTKRSNGLAEAFRFNPAKPTSILYSRDSVSGKLTLLGAMYTMPRRAREAKLDSRVPLSIAQWHLHTNLCLPPRDAQSRYAEKRNGVPIFGLEGTIVTRPACDTEGGRFHETVFGWMIHANVFAGTDIASIWGHAEGAGHAHPQSSKPQSTP